VWLIGTMVCLLAAPWVQLFVSAGNGWPYNALRHHWLMPISCHFRDCTVLLVTSLIHVKWRLHMTISLQTGMQTRCPYRFANRSSCVNSQIHCFQTGRLSDRKNQTCLILAIRQTTRAMCKRSCDRYYDWFAKYLAAHWLTVYQWT